MPSTKEKAPSGLPSRMELSSGRPLSRKDKSITENPRKQDLCAENAQNEHTESKELRKHFVPRKKESLKLAESYRRISLRPEYERTEKYESITYLGTENGKEKFLFTEKERTAANLWTKKAERVKTCGEYLEFAHEFDGVEVSPEGKLHQAYFCKDRLCPMCQRRRSLKIFGQVSQILELIGGEYTFLFLTLTVRNCTAECLSETLKRLNSAFDAFARYKRIKKVLKGYFRALEITYNEKRDDYHPHYHCIIAVPKAYMKSRDYLNHEEWLNLWRKAYKDESIQMVNIKAITKRMQYDESLPEGKNLEKAIAEACKYSVKGSDILHDDNEQTDKVVLILSESLYHKRLATFSGCFKEAYIKLGLDDAESENADLTHISGKLNPALTWLICRYEWSLGTYKLTGQRIERPEEHTER